MLEAGEKVTSLMALKEEFISQKSFLVFFIGPQEAGEIASKMIGASLITKQTPPEGVAVKNCMIAHSLDIERETYLAILYDRESQGPVIVGSPAGGVEIEEVAEATPELILSVFSFCDQIPVDIDVGVTKEQAKQMVDHLGFEGKKAIVAAEQVYLFLA